MSLPNTNGVEDMPEIQLTVMEYHAGSGDALKALLDEFRRQYRIKVNLTTIPWSRGWNTIADMAIYGHGADVSEVGSTWAYSLASMNALRFFSPVELPLLDEEDAFIAPLLTSCRDVGASRAWAVPWLADPQILIYRRDALERAGINDPDAAFSTFPAFRQTLQQLQASGIPRPLALTTRVFSPIMHEAARWVWGMGGDFVDPIQQRVAFTDPEALAGLEAYFGLLPFVAPDSPHDMFMSMAEGHTVMAFATSSTLVALQALGAQVAGTLGGHAGPGIPYVGGTNLVVWRHARQTEAALKLVRFLLQSTESLEGSPHARLFTARQTVLEALESSPRSEHISFAQALRTGRAFPTMRLWGRIEQSFTQSLAFLWQRLAAEPTANPTELLHQELDYLAGNLNAALTY